jgi:hypothetical protein
MRVRDLCIASVLVAAATAMGAAEAEAAGPVLVGVSEAEAPQGGGRVLLVLGSGVNKYKSMTLADIGGTDIAPMTILVKSKNVLMVQIPPVLDRPTYALPGEYMLKFSWGKVTGTINVWITMGYPDASTVDSGALEAALRTDLDDAATVGGETATSLHSWANLTGVPGGFADGVDNDTSVTAGAGLVLSGTTLSADFVGTGGDFGTANTVARSNHLHDGRYYTEAELNAAGGTINAAANPVDWSRLKGVPAGIADGVDANTAYAAGAGLSLTGTTFDVLFAGSGAANSSSRSDHTHTSFANAVAVTGNVAGTLLSGVNASTTAGISGVFGQSSAGTGSTYGVHGASNNSNGRGVYGTGAYGVYGSGNSYGLYGAGGPYGGYGNGSTYGLYGQGGAYGVYGNGSTYGVYGNDSSGGNYGVYGFSTSNDGVHGQSTNWAGLRGDSTFLGAYCTSNASTGTAYGVYGSGTSSSGSGFGVYGTGTTYGVFCSGNFAASGTKSFVQKHPEDPTKAIVYVCLEGGESGTYCRGSGRLVDGEARIDLPAHFPLVTSPDGITAQVTPTAECRGLYVAAKNHRFLIVRELGGGASGATFDWTVNGVRAGYEHHEPISSDPGLIRALDHGNEGPAAVAGRPPHPEPEPPPVPAGAPAPAVGR